MVLSTSCAYSLAYNQEGHWLCGITYHCVNNSTHYLKCSNPLPLATLGTLSLAEPRNTHLIRSECRCSITPIFKNRSRILEEIRSVLTNSYKLKNVIFNKKPLRPRNLFLIWISYVSGALPIWLRYIA